MIFVDNKSHKDSSAIIEYMDFSQFDNTRSRMTSNSRLIDIVKIDNID